MSSYGQFCPLSKGAEVFGGRWTPLILRELMMGTCHFSDLQRGIPKMSRTTLALRLKELEDAGVVVSVAKDRGRGREYRLTEAGEALRPVVQALSDWAQVHVPGTIDRSAHDPAQLLWALHRWTDRTQLPEERFVLRFEFRNLPHKHRLQRLGWLVIYRADMDVCLKDPGYDADAVIRADIGAFIRVWLGHAGLVEAVRTGDIAIEGSAQAQAVARTTLALPPTPCLKSFIFAETPEIRMSETRPAA
jgi:DNA-binding HxlR family transcriptional regulator